MRLRAAVLLCLADRQDLCLKSRIAYAAMVMRRFSQPVQVAVIVTIGKEAGAAIIAALDDVLRQAGLVKSNSTGHVRQCNSSAAGNEWLL